MRLDYEKFKELSLGSLNEQGDQLGCFWVIQSAVEGYFNGDGNINQKQINLLKELGILSWETDRSVLMAESKDSKKPKMKSINIKKPNRPKRKS